MTLDPVDFCTRMVKGMPDAVIYADADGTIRFWNPGASRMFGFQVEEALGRSLDLIIPESLRARHGAGYRRTMETGHTSYGAGEVLAVPALCKDGRRISVEFTIVPFRDPDGRMSGIGAVLRDVTVRFEETRALRRDLASLRGPVAE